MKRLVLCTGLLLAACGSGRSTNCQLLFDCCHSNPTCAMTSNRGDDHACQVAFDLESSKGLCQVDAGRPDGGPDSGPVDGGGRDSGPACGMYGADCTSNACCTGLSCNAMMMTCL